MKAPRPISKREPKASGAHSSAPDASLPAGLYVVSTPIGNLADITIRAIDVLRRCDFIASEDTRTTVKLLSRYDIHTPLTSYHQHSEGRKTSEIFQRICDGARVALVSEAGTPVISDPGSDLISLCIRAGCLVTAIPGACALTHFLVCSGLNAASFVFVGFPPRKPGERSRFFTGMAAETRTVVMYESPNRLRTTLEAIREAMPGRRVCVGRELTKLFEEFWRGTIEDAVAEFTARRPRGEFVVGLAGAGPSSDAAADMEEEYRRLIAEGVADRDAVSALSRLSGRPRKEVYAAVLKWKGKR